MLAARLAFDFAEADTFHSAANVARMQGGTPLTDEDRWPWLDAIADWVDSSRRAGKPCVVACSALRRSYRERLARGHKDVCFVYLQGHFNTVAARLAGRTGHYMPPSLLASQFETLEEPGNDEPAIALSIEQPADALVDEIVRRLNLS